MLTLVFKEPQIKILNIRGNSIPEEAMESISEIIKSNSLCKLDIGGKITN
jgi:Ran GTPase-activating protein (RanGAP) involved in mRNA processing and transport